MRDIIMQITDLDYTRATDSQSVEQAKPVSSGRSGRAGKPVNSSVDSTPEDAASRQQIRALLALWDLYAQPDNSRDARINWAINNIGRPITSFTELTRKEAASLIATAQIGLEVRGC